MLVTSWLNSTDFIIEHLKFMFCRSKLMYFKLFNCTDKFHWHLSTTSSHMCLLNMTMITNYSPHKYAINTIMLPCIFVSQFSISVHSCGRKQPIAKTFKQFLSDLWKINRYDQQMLLHFTRMKFITLWRKFTTAFCVSILNKHCIWNTISNTSTPVQLLSSACNQIFHCPRHFIFSSFKFLLEIIMWINQLLCFPNIQTILTIHFNCQTRALKINGREKVQNGTRKFTSGYNLMTYSKGFWR